MLKENKNIKIRCRRRAFLSFSTNMTDWLVGSLSFIVLIFLIPLWFKNRTITPMNIFKNSSLRRNISEIYNPCTDKILPLTPTCLIPILELSVPIPGTTSQRYSLSASTLSVPFRFLSNVPILYNVEEAIVFIGWLRVIRLNPSPHPPISHYSLSLV